MFTNKFQSARADCFSDYSTFPAISVPKVPTISGAEVSISWFGVVAKFGRRVLWMLLKKSRTSPNFTASSRTSPVPRPSSRSTCAIVASSIRDIKLPYPSNNGRYISDDRRCLRALLCRFVRPIPESTADIHKFPKLPGEIQKIIWKSAVPDPRDVPALSLYSSTSISRIRKRFYRTQYVLGGCMLSITIVRNTILSIRAVDQ